MVGDIWYRLDASTGDMLAMDWNWAGDPLYHVHLNYRQFKVIKETPKGVWLDVYGCKKFVLNDSKKRYAYPTKVEARESFIHRKRRHIAILKYQLTALEAQLETVEATPA